MNDLKQSAEQTEKEYIETKTSWKWFERAIENKQMQPQDGQKCVKEIELMIQIEILKELQYLNSKR